MNQWRFEISQNTDSALMYGAHEGIFSADATREEVDEFRLTLIVNAVSGVYEKSYYSNRYGLLGFWGRVQRDTFAPSHPRRSGGTSEGR